MAQAKKGPKNLVLFTLVVVVLCVLLVMLNQASKKAEVTESLASAPDIANQPVEGSVDAKVAIMEFGDYKCPSCKAWSDQIYPKLKKDYIDTGIVKFSYINVLFHGEESQLGAMAGESVWSENPESFWPFHKALFQAQPTDNHDAPWITPDKILEIANKIEPPIDVAKLQQDLDMQATLPQVGRDQELVQDFQIEQTPTIIVNNVKLQNPFDYDTLVKLIEDGQ
ncbi:thioredoxin domain-containing protein [Paenibacillus sepulcri]|uniref:DsbA family protein n=1 Tax=Paenibacillus sepulcri TaxID=359917 RepID=A0ABS7C8H7_9BACL|nr:DsbA family protein [Paenibacillus sepulcri]